MVGFYKRDSDCLSFTCGLQEHQGCSLVVIVISVHTQSWYKHAELTCKWLRPPFVDQSVRVFSHQPWWPAPGQRHLRAGVKQTKFWFGSFFCLLLKPPHKPLYTNLKKERLKKSKCSRCTLTRLNKARVDTPSLRPMCFRQTLISFPRISCKRNNRCIFQKKIWNVILSAGGTARDMF